MVDWYELPVAEVMSREHEVAAAAASQLTEQIAVQQLAAKQALKQVSPLCILVRFPAALSNTTK